MHLVRASVVGWLVLAFVVAGGGGVASTACFVCEERTLRQHDCSELHGTFDDESCTCEGPENGMAYPTASASIPTGAGIPDCGIGRHYRVTGACVVDGGDLGCARYASGYCTSSECTSDLDCSAGAGCVVDDGGIGTCLVPCLPDAVCPPTRDLGRCSRSDDCRAEAGAECRLGWCYGPEDVAPSMQLSP